jgi:putative ABC transport system permease protein
MCPGVNGASRIRIGAAKLSMVYKGFTSAHDLLHPGRWPSSPISATRSGSLKRALCFTSIAIASLALGLGANTAIFNVLDQVLLRPLPVNHPRELVQLTSPGPIQGRVDGDDVHRLFSRPVYAELRDGNQVFAGLIARAPIAANLGYKGQSEAVVAELASGNYFEVLGVRPGAGRLLSAQDDLTKNAHPVVVLGYSYWM